MVLQTLRADLPLWMPELILSAGALLVMLVGAFAKRPRVVIATTWLVLLAALAGLLGVPATPTEPIFFGLILCDPFSLVFRWVALGTVAFVILLVMGSEEIAPTLLGECLGLILLIGVGLMLMAEASHLLMAYLAMELVSLSSYMLVAFLRDTRSAEASLKYLLFGALASGIMLFGMSLLFGLTGELSFAGIRQATSGIASPMLEGMLLAMTLVLVGVAFKISMVPFHMWTPDVYEGAPIAVTALLSVGPKAAGLALALRLFTALAPLWTRAEGIVVVLTILTMTLGNVVALVQTNVKRLLAYSTIGQVGYLLIGFAVNTTGGLEGILVYVIAYLLMNLGAFACVAAVVRDTGSESLDAFRGLAYRAPALALLCAVFLLSLAGIPPLFGFIGKFLLFGSAIEAGKLSLALAGVANSAIALYYYVNIIRWMYLQSPVSPRPLQSPRSVALTLGVCGAATIVLGIFPGPLLDAIRAGAGGLL